MSKLTGHSGAVVELIDGLVYKSGRGIDRNYSRMSALGSLISQPVVIEYDGSSLITPYIHGTTIAEYLTHNTVDGLVEFICGCVDTLGGVVNNPTKDYYPVYEARLSKLEYLPAGIGEIIGRLPRYLPGTQYHGDLTFDNMIATADDFVLIDAIDTDLDNVYFDLAKLRQDVDCGWFMRNSIIGDNMAIKLRDISGRLAARYTYYSNNAMAILALSRVWAYSTRLEQEWISNEMDMLWRSKC